VSLSLCKVGMLACLAMDVASCYQTTLGGIDSMFEPRFTLVEWTVWYREVLWSAPTRNWFVSSVQSLLPTVQAAIEFFDCSLFNSLPVSPRQSNMLISPGGRCVTALALRLWQLSIMPCLQQTNTAQHCAVLSSVFHPSPTLEGQLSISPYTC
jgi:hypothetical protein